MPIATILQALDAEGERQLAEIAQAAQAEIAQIQAHAQAEAATLQQQHLTTMQAALHVERARILNRARLASLRVMMAAREELMAQVAETAAQQLAALPTTPAYAEVLQQLIRETADTLGNPLTLQAHARDVALVRRIAQEMGVTATIEGGLDCLGGVAGISPDGRIRLLNTLEARLQRLLSLQRAQMGELLFGRPPENEPCPEAMPTAIPACGPCAAAS